MSQGFDVPDPRALLRAIDAELQTHGDPRSILALAEGTLSVRAETTGWSAEGGVLLELALPARHLAAVLGSPRVQDELGHAAARAVAAAGPRSYLGLGFGYARPGAQAAYRGASPGATVDAEGARVEARELLDASACEAASLWVEDGVLCTEGVPAPLRRWLERIAAAHGVPLR